MFYRKLLILITILVGLYQASEQLHDFSFELPDSLSQSLVNAEHPVVGGEMLCFDYNTVDGVCHAFGQSVIFKQDTVYDRSDLNAIIFKET